LGLASASHIKAALQVRLERRGMRGDSLRARRGWDWGGGKGRFVERNASSHPFSAVKPRGGRRWRARGQSKEGEEIIGEDSGETTFGYRLQPILGFQKRRGGGGGGGGKERESAVKARRSSLLLRAFRKSFRDRRGESGIQREEDVAPPQKNQKIMLRRCRVREGAWKSWRWGQL